MEIHPAEAVVPGHFADVQRVVDAAVGGLVGQVRQQVQGGAVLLGVLDGLEEDGILLKAAVLHGGVQTDIVLHHAAARAQVGVARLRVAGLSRAQTHELAGGVELGPGLLRQQRIPVGSVGQMDGVAVVAGAKAPTVADNQEHLPPLSPVFVLAEGPAVHLGGLGNAHNVQHRGRHVTQGAVPQPDGTGIGGVDHDKGHQIGGVGPVGLAGGGVELFNVAVVGGDGHHIPLAQGVVHHLVQVLTHIPAGLDLGPGVLGVADDVAVGKVGHHEVILAQGVHYGVRHLGQGELRLLVKVDALGRGEAQVILPGEGIVLAAVEEEGHVGELLALSAVELGLPRLAEDLGQGLYHLGRGKGDGQVLKLVVVHGHDDEIQIVQHPALRLVKLRLREHLGELDLPLAPAAAEDGGVAVRDLAHRLPVLYQNHGLQVVVVLTQLVCPLDGLSQLSAAAFDVCHIKKPPVSINVLSLPLLRPDDYQT